jgi:tetratricopeptide (TPR) repeat protein
MNQGNTRRRLLAVIALVSCAFLSHRAYAQGEADKRQQAKERYEMATRLYDVGKYAEAISEYEEAYLLVEDAALLFNIGQAYRLWDHPEEAIRSYKNYLRRRPDATNRAEVEKKIADLEKVVEERKRNGALPPVAPPPQPPLPGQPALASPAQRGYQAQPGSPTDLAPPPAAQPPLPGTDVGAATKQPVQPPAQKWKWVPYALVGASGACLLTSIVAGAIGASKAKRLQDASQNHEVFDSSVEKSGKAANGVALVAALGAVLTGGAGGYLWWRARRQSSPSVAAVVTPVFAGASATVPF